MRRALAAPAALAVALVLLAVPARAHGEADGEDESMGCTRTLAPGDDLAEAVEEAEAGDVLCLEAGTHEAYFLQPNRELTLRAAEGADEVVVKAARSGPIVYVDGGDGTLTLEGLTLRGAKGTRGALGLDAQEATVRVEDCVFEDHDNPRSRGGAVVVQAGQLEVVRSVFRNNHATAEGGGAAIYAGQIADVELRDSLLVGAEGEDASLFLAGDGARVTLSFVTAVARGDGPALALRGKTTQQPEVTVEDSLLRAAETAIALPDDEAFRSELHVRRSVVSGGLPDGVDGEDVEDAPVSFTGGDGPEAWRPEAGGPASGRGRAEEGASDLRGTERPSEATAGALEAASEG